MEAVTSEGGALCAAHEGAQSTGTCERCGNFVCPLCLDVDSALPEHCESCREREGGGLIPWERDDASWLSRYWRTCKGVVFRPTRTFEESRPGSLKDATMFTLLTGLWIGGSISLLGGCAVGGLLLTGGLGADLSRIGGSEQGVVGVLLVCALLGYAIFTPAALVISVVIRAGIFHGVVAMLGGQGGFSASYWSMSYLHAISLSFLPLLFVQQIPVIGPFIGLIATLAIEVWYALQLSTVARRYHGLEDGRASVAGWSVFMLTVGLGLLCCLSTVGLALAGRA